MTAVTGITGRDALADGLTPDNPPTHLSVLLELAGGRVRADLTVEVDHECDTRDLWELRSRAWDATNDGDMYTGGLVDDGEDYVSAGMREEILDELESLCAAEGIPATWDDFDPITVFAWVADGFQIVLETIYEDEGKYRLQSLPGVVAWRWHTADDPESLLSVALTPAGAYGIKAVDPTTAGAIVCGSCGRAWTDDITPAGRCPWEELHLDSAPVVP